jgi:hypothetical protein
MKKVKWKVKDIILKADRNLFGHMVVVAKGRMLDMRKVHPRGLTIPWALANGDDSLRKTNRRLDFEMTSKRMYHPL